MRSTDGFVGSSSPICYYIGLAGRVQACGRDAGPCINSYALTAGAIHRLDSCMVLGQTADVAKRAEPRQKFNGPDRVQIFYSIIIQYYVVVVVVVERTD